MLQAYLSTELGAQLGRLVVNFHFRFVLDLYLAREVCGDFAHDLITENLI